MALLYWDDVHIKARRALRRGDAQPTTPDDVSAFQHPPRTSELERKGTPLGSGIIDGDLLTFVWQPLFWLAFPFGVSLLTGGLGAIWAIMEGEEQTYWVWFAWIFTPLGLFLLWYSLLARYFRQMIFDRRRGLVHVPHLLSRRLDTVRFADLDVLLVRVPTGFHGMESVIRPYLARPGYNFALGDYPRPWHRVPFLVADPNPPDTAEWLWRQIVAFMTRPIEESPWAVQNRRGDHAVAKLDYNGNWAAMRRAMHQNDLRLYGSKLLTAPNWYRDANGDWHRTAGGERERIDYPHGPQENRVPCEPGRTSVLGPYCQPRQRLYRTAGNNTGQGRDHDSAAR